MIKNILVIFTFIIFAALFVGVSFACDNSSEILSDSQSSLDVDILSDNDLKLLSGSESSSGRDNSKNHDSKSSSGSDSSSSDKSKSSSGSEKDYKENYIIIHKVAGYKKILNKKIKIDSMELKRLKQGLKNGDTEMMGSKVAKIVKKGYYNSCKYKIKPVKVLGKFWGNGLYLKKLLVKVTLWKPYYKPVKIRSDIFYG